MNKRISINITPSRVGTYYEKLCNRDLISDAITLKEDRNNLGLVVEKKLISAASLAGNEWEKELYLMLKEQEKEEGDSLEIIAKEKLETSADDRVNFTFEETVDILRNLQKGKRYYIYQSCICATESFQKKYIHAYQKYASKNLNIQFSEQMYPDFIYAEYSEFDKKFHLTVIDVKNAEFVKANAEIQIGLYALLLEDIIKTYEIDNCVINKEEGVVWNKEKITKKLLVHSFELKDALFQIEDFFATRLDSACGLIQDCNSGDELLGKLPCRMSIMCQYCLNYDKCVELARGKRSVVLLPYITEEAQNRIEELVTSQKIADESWETVKAALLADDEITELLIDGCNYWRNVKNDIEAYDAAFTTYLDGGADEKFRRKGSTYSFPRSHNLGLYVTAQRDVATGRIYAYAWYLTQGFEQDIFGLGLNSNGFANIDIGEKQIGRGTVFQALVAKQPTDEEFNRIDRAFVNGIYEILTRCVSKIPEIKKRRLQFFVMDKYEHKNIEAALFNMLEYVDPALDQELLEKIMTIIFWLQGERLVVSSDKQVENTVDNPVSVIISAISKLYVLPRAIAYNLVEASKIFSINYNFANDTGYYFEKLSDVMSDMPILYIWRPEVYKKNNNTKKDFDAETYIGYMENHLIRRLSIESRIVNEIQQDDEIILSTHAETYYLPEKEFEDCPEIACLNFENRYEELLKYHDIMSVRMKGIDAAIENGTILSLECLDHETYKVLNWENYVGRDWFNAWICEDTPQNREQILKLRDIYYNRNFKPMIQIGDDDGNSYFYAKSMDDEVEFEDTGTEVKIKLVAMKDKVYNYELRKKVAETVFYPVPGERYLFFEIYKDYNSPKTKEGLSRLCGRDYFLNPAKLSQNGNMNVAWSDEVQRVCSTYWEPDGHGFSESQKKAFIHLFNRKLTVLVGPPAAGKSDFIARTIITLCSYYQEARGKKLKVLVSALSHSAFENVLIKVNKMLQAAGDRTIYPTIALYNVNSKQVTLGGACTVITQDYDERDYVQNQIDNEEIAVYGMTGWSAQKDSPKNNLLDSPKFDLVIIDEASQVRAMDAFLQLECVKPGGRILLVGDDDQLPPIIGGKYPMKENEKYIHGSIFKMYLSALRKAKIDELGGLEAIARDMQAGVITVPDHEDVIRLNDNFRMNEVLCRYSEKMIYKSGYKASLPSIAVQKITLRNRPEDELLDYMLDPEYPLVFCKLQGNSNSQRLKEIELVKALVKHLWENAENKDGSLAKDAGNFWDEKILQGRSLDGTCGIISPHHKHINRLKSAVAEELGVPRADIFIGTVDRLQGKERQNIIVSYGVYEQENALNESEFIFSRNRFNVSITRGKAKTIVFLSDVIAESNLAMNVLQAKDDKLRDGVKFLHKFEEFMSTAQADEDITSKNYKFALESGDVSLKIMRKRVK